MKQKACRLFAIIEMKKGGLVSSNSSDRRFAEKLDVELVF